MKLNGNFFTLVFLLVAGTSSLMAQSTVTSGSSVDDQVSKFTQMWQDAYNRADVKTLGSLFTADGERTDSEGTSLVGTDQISSYYANVFKSGKWSVVIRPESSTQQADGSLVSTGSFKATGTKADGTTEVRSGTFRNELVRKDKQLLIRRMKLFASL